MRIAILGAGIQGVSTALALASEQIEVSIFDQNSAVLGGASGVGEGKIHLGFVYANDTSFRTSNLMLEGAMHFAPLLERWIGQTLDWRRFCSTPFQYLVAVDSLLDAPTLLEHYALLDRTYREKYSGTELHYLGNCPDRLYESDSLGSTGSSEKIIHSISTCERAIGTPLFRDFLSGLIGSNGRIKTRFRRKICEVSRKPEGFLLKGEFLGDKGTWAENFDIVINCLWDGRLALDAQMGLAPQRPWVFRRKFGIHASFESHQSLPASATIVLGPFGDIVCYPEQRTAYLSYYPYCLQGWSHELTVPASWRGEDGQIAGEETLTRIVYPSLKALAEYVPEIRSARATEIRSGVIFSWGKSDIDDRQSELHRRDEIGVLHTDGYFSINTGKFTMAPLFAKITVDQIMGRSIENPA